MSYQTITQCTNDQAFTDRVSAAIAQEQRGDGDVPAPHEWINPMRWWVASASDVEAAYASALAGGNPDPGGDPAVITDGMILANVQAGWDVVVGPGN